MNPICDSFKVLNRDICFHQLPANIAEIHKHFRSTKNQAEASYRLAIPLRLLNTYAVVNNI